MCFITYYDLRAAMLAREQLHGADINGRKIDVHYSLPKEDETLGNCGPDKNQGTVFLTVHGLAGQINDFKLSQAFSECGEIKDILPHGNSPKCVASPSC